MKNPTLAKLALLLLIMLAACDDTLPSRAKILLWNYGNLNITVDMVGVQVQSIGSERHLTGNAFYPDPVRSWTTNYPTFHRTDYFPTDTEGDFTALVKIIDGGMTVAEGQISTQLIEDYSLSIIIVLSTGGPNYGCHGCGLQVGFPINAAYIDSTLIEGEMAKFDSLYIMISGNWITNPENY